MPLIHAPLSWNKDGRRDPHLQLNLNSMDLELSIYSLSQRSSSSIRSRCGILRLTRKASELEQLSKRSDGSGAVHYKQIISDARMRGKGSRGTGQPAHLVRMAIFRDNGG